MCFEVSVLDVVELKPSEPMGKRRAVIIETEGWALMGCELIDSPDSPVGFKTAFPGTIDTSQIVSVLGKLSKEQVLGGLVGTIAADQRGLWDAAIESYMMQQPVKIYP